MEVQYSCTIVSKVLLFPFLFLLVISNVHVSASTSVIDNFLKCVPTRSTTSHPISNAIYTPSNSSFLNVLQNYVRDSRFNTSLTPKPLAIVTALDVSHVQVTVICAKTNGVQIRIRSGGHDFEGLSYISNDPFIILDMFNLRSIDIDIPNEIASIQAGATLGELYYKIAQKSNIHAFPAGVCFTLGAGGHFSGGGYGNMLRQYGLSIDNIIDAQVVDANGRILNRKSMGEDLFWAIRGGGGASFCVILSWKIKLVRVPDIVTVFNVQKTLEEGATNIVLQWQKIATTIDRKLFIRVQPQVIQQGGKKTVQVSFIGQYLGRANTLLTLMKKSFPLLSLQAQDCSEMPWIETTLFWYGNPKGTPIEVLLQRTPTSSHSYGKHKSDFVKKPIPREGLEMIWRKMIEAQILDNILLLQWNPYGGRMNEIEANATAFPHRAGNLFKIQYITLWQDDSAETTSKNLEATRKLYDAFTPYVSKNPRQAFLNYRDIDIGTNEQGSLVFASDFFMGNVKRLLQVKANVDPTNFFRYEQSIPVLPKDKKVDIQEKGVVMNGLRKSSY
ncbi:berberine bridge enzyme-like 4 [Beta vulgaris subsp. vulgaris]|uniref:berberine bridge enzyme-like 4 n=1 Tax=Beta vulgaris subsp. vulgaris TaxID=3555 RepID=UPI0020374B86|nr:berberine bridge enzyme-like 4 [Beta vulgaris subsp. vulgaris]